MEKQSKNKVIAIFEGKKFADFGMMKKNYGIFPWLI